MGFARIDASPHDPSQRWFFYFVADTLVDGRLFRIPGSGHERSVGNAPHIGRSGKCGLVLTTDIVGVGA